MPAELRYNPPMHCDVERVLLSQEQIARRVRELAGQIAAAFASPDPQVPAELTIMPVMTGAMIFAADLIRQLPMRMKIGLLTVSSYPGQSIESQGARLLSQHLGEIRGRHVLLLDDILDTGGTVRLVRSLLQAMQPASLKVCVFLRKPTPGALQTPVDFVGFDIPDQFVVGYGLDYDDYYRNLPEIVTLKAQVLAPRAPQVWKDVS